MLKYLLIPQKKGERMTILRNRDYTGYSDTSLEHAIANALEKAGKDANRIKVIETRSSQPDDKRHYQATLTTFTD